VPRAGCAGFGLPAHDQAARDQVANDWKTQVSTPTGRRFVWGLLCDAGVFRSTFTADSRVHAFNEGTRNLGLAILTNLNTYANTNTKSNIYTWAYSNTWTYRNAWSNIDTSTNRNNTRSNT
jgi:hypothetical protein